MYAIPAFFASAMSSFQCPVAANFFPPSVVVFPTFQGLTTSNRRSAFAHSASLSVRHCHWHHPTRVAAYRVSALKKSMTRCASFAPKRSL